MQISHLSNYITRMLVVCGFLLVATLPAYAFNPNEPLSGDKALGCGIIGVDAKGDEIIKVCPILTGVPQVLKNTGLYLMLFVTIMLVVSVGYLIIWKYVASDDEGAQKQIKSLLTSKVVTFIALGLLMAGFFTVVFNTFVKPEFNVFMNQLSVLPPQFFLIFDVPHIYAADTASQHLPNGLVVETPYDLAIIFYQFAMRWVLIPVLIAWWVRAGFTFVIAQGNPDKIKLAKDRLWRSLVGTVVLMMLLAIAYALRDTINQIVG